MRQERKAQRSFIQGLIGFFERGLFAPFLLALQPVIRLFIVNAEDVYFLDAIRPMVVALLLGGASLLVAYFLLRNWIKASVIASLFMVLFFLFGDLSDWVI